MNARFVTVETDRLGQPGQLADGIAEQIFVADDCEIFCAARAPANCRRFRPSYHNNRFVLRETYP